MQNILLIHGFNGIPKIFQYFKEELEKLDYNVIMPEFPVREEITVERYFEILDKYKEFFNENLIVVAHSIGNPMFIKYISKNGLKELSEISKQCSNLYPLSATLDNAIKERTHFIELSSIPDNELVPINKIKKHTYTEIVEYDLYGDYMNSVWDIFYPDYRELNGRIILLYKVEYNDKLLGLWDTLKFQSFFEHIDALCKSSIDSLIANYAIQPLQVL